MDLLTQAHLGVFQLCLWPLIAPGYLREGCHASHQPSDASIPSLSLHLYILHHIITVAYIFNVQTALVIKLNFLSTYQVVLPHYVIINNITTVAESRPTAGNILHMHAMPP